MQKRYVFLIIIMVLVGVLIWKVSTSYAAVDQGYHGQNIISGNKWGVNIIKVGDVLKEGKAEVMDEVDTIGTTLNFNALLFEPGDMISFDITVSNTSLLDAELYALTLTGLSREASEFITYEIMPIDSSVIHTDEVDGSIIKSGEEQKFNISVRYDENAKQDKEYNLSLGSTIIYKQK